MNPDFNVAINRLAEEKVKKIVIYTNGTIVPPDGKIECLKNNKVLLIITDYGSLSRNLNNLSQKLSENIIAFYVQKARGWTDCAKIGRHYWGAGHQAFAVIALANLAGKIKYVVDSASFKQSKYTPTTHIPIVAPDKLLSEPVEAIIIMAGSYSDEVAKIIKKSYNKNLKIAILRDFGIEIKV